MISCRASILVLTAFLLNGCAKAVDETIDTEKHRISVTTVAGGLRNPWGIDFLPEGGMLVTERPGTLRRVSMSGRVDPPIKGVPGVDARGQGGLLDVTLHPDFARNRLVYLSYSERQGRVNGTAVARGRLSADAGALENVEVIFRQEPKAASTLHFGSRIVFDGKGHVFITLGERFDDEFRVQAQDLGSLLGKIVRLNEDGTVPADNPFVGRAGARPEIWSYGHRNVQGAAIHPETGDLWESEHGPMGGDELNIARPGLNYGWPVISYGVNYDGTPVGTGRSQAAGMEEPVVQWTPVIAAAGMTFYTADMFPRWRGNLFVSGLAGNTVVRLELDGDRVTHEERLFEDSGLRFRDVQVGPDGALYLLTDESNGEVIRVAAN